MKYLPSVTQKTICNKLFGLMPSPLFQTKIEEEQIEKLKMITQELEGIEDIACGEIRNASHYGVRMSIKIKYSGGYQSMDCGFYFEKSGHLEFNMGRSNCYLNNINQIIELKEALQKAAIIADKRAIELEANAVKRDKIKEIKRKAIVAKALELVKIEKVPYIIDDSFTTKIVIFIRLSDIVRLEVNVPYSNYQIVLQNTQAAIKAIREFADKGIAINVRTSGATTPYYDWKYPN